jgi:hypothetical protein
MVVAAQRVDPGWRHGDAVLTVFDFFGDTDNHWDNGWICDFRWPIYDLREARTPIANRQSLAQSRLTTVVG